MTSRQIAYASTKIIQISSRFLSALIMVTCRCLSSFPHRACHSCHSNIGFMPSQRPSLWHIYNSWLSTLRTSCHIRRALRLQFVLSATCPETRHARNHHNHKLIVDLHHHEETPVIAPCALKHRSSTTSCSSAPSANLLSASLNTPRILFFALSWTSCVSSNTSAWYS